MSQPHKRDTPLPNTSAVGHTARNTQLQNLIGGRSNLHRFVKWRVVKTNWFTGVVMTAIMLNAIMTAFETDDKIYRNNERLLRLLDNIFLGIYVVEFLLKFYAEPIDYWKSMWNLFDFAIVLVSLVQELIPSKGLMSSRSGFQILRAFRIVRTIRVLRAVRFIRGLEVLVVALAQTLRQWVISVLGLMLLLMYITAIIGHNVFGKKDTENWGTLRVCFISLASYVTTDGWYDRQYSLETKGYFAGSRFFALAVIWTLNFMFTNLFVAVILNNIDEATSKFQEEEAERKAKILRHKKDIMMMHQREDLKLLTQCQQKGQFQNFQQMVAEFQNALKHEDIVVVSDLCTNIVWMETYLLTMEKMEGLLYSIQQLHFELANTFSQALEPYLAAKYGM